MAVSGLKELASMFEEEGRLESSALKIVEEFLKNFPVSVTSTRKAAVNHVMSSFPTELLQFVFSFLPIEDLNSAVMVCKRWQEVGEVMKLWEDKRVVFLEDDSMYWLSKSPDIRPEDEDCMTFFVFAFAVEIDLSGLKQMQDYCCL